MNKTITPCTAVAISSSRSLSKLLPLQDLYTPLRGLKRHAASFLLVFAFLFSFVGEGWGQSFAIVGNGTAANTTTGYPAPMGNYYFGARHQFFVTAAQLTAAGVSSNSMISSVGFNVTNTNSTPNLTGFQIKVYTTSAANPISAGWLTTGLVGQSNAANITLTTGWNQISLASSFAWNGTSNLVIETCFNNTGYGSNASTQWTTTGLGTGTWSRWYRADASGVCANTLSTNTSTTCVLGGRRCALALQRQQQQVLA
jgi:hypothetical protein